MKISDIWFIFFVEMHLKYRNTQNINQNNIRLRYLIYICLPYRRFFFLRFCEAVADSLDTVPVPAKN